MKVLIIADEVWNDEVHGNNVLSNWFQDFDAEFAEIYCSPGMPNNDCCERYFQLTDIMMLKSIIGKRAGKQFFITKQDMKNNSFDFKGELVSKQFYSFMKSITTDSIRVIRDLIWLFGRYDNVALKKFIDEFDPDIVFCPRLLTPKLLRLEKSIAKMTTAPFVAFTADDEASMRQISYSPIYWVRRLLFRYAFKKHVKLYKHYFTFSEEQAKDYAVDYGITTSTLFKSGNFEDIIPLKRQEFPLKMVYAGRLYCNRWKTLSFIGEVLGEINKNEQKILLDIYTQEKLTSEQLKALTKNSYVQLKGRVSARELSEIYANSNIALHVESFDKKHKYATRVSFSTKIIDLMSSSCAILAICWDQHAGYQYLQKHDAALCVSNYYDIRAMLDRICDNPEVISEYALKGWSCGKMNHTKEKIHKEIRSIFANVITLSQNP